VIVSLRETQKRKLPRRKKGKKEEGIIRGDF
jgi:hypothetical protein